MRPRGDFVSHAESGSRAHLPLWRRRPFWDLLALGALAVTVGTGAARMTQPLILPVSRTPAPPADPAALESHVRFLTEVCVPRHDRHPENLDRAADHIASSLTGSGGRVAEMHYQALGETSRVVLARFGPEGPTAVVVGAHYDACGSTPGADDNASGVAGLLELGRLLGESPPASCVELAAYPHEEDFGSPIMGSVRHARSLRERGEEPAAMISLEMIGFFSDEPGSQQYPISLLRALYPDRGNFVALVGRGEERALLRRVKRSMAGARGIAVRSICPPFSVPGTDLSDHWSFQREGFRGIMVTDTAFYRNRRYHTPEDTADTLDYGRMAHVVSGVFAAVRDLAADTPREARGSAGEAAGGKG